MQGRVCKGNNRLKGITVKTQIDWDEYAQRANLGTNRLTYDHHKEVVDDFVNCFADVPKERKILDVGCARGFFLVILRPCLQVRGSYNYIGFLRHRAEEFVQTFLYPTQCRGS